MDMVDVETGSPDEPGGETGAPSGWLGELLTDSDEDMAFWRDCDCLLGGRTIIEPSSARRILFLVSSTPLPAPPASASFFACRLIWRLRRSGREKWVKHRWQVYPLFAVSWFSECRRRCSARVKALSQPGYSHACFFMANCTAEEKPQTPDYIYSISGDDKRAG
jgi:hypothetical protein